MLHLWDGFIFQRMRHSAFMRPDISRNLNLSLESAKKCQQIKK
ncbi:Uncharacterized protein dnm_041600 [Desulfonema magnum]|uniref:Uncharacterized protein n=1 Tax=Desulfonema magnum TaxID=45655 RepID=A0A975BNE9_9BACT|nr:Uncharacterized protein dnm_041600 [Desulfonema magnum]